MCEIFDGILMYIFMRVLMLGFGTFRMISLLMECLCMVVMVTRGLVFHPLFCMVLISGSYQVCLCVRACSE